MLNFEKIKEAKRGCSDKESVPRLITFLDQLGIKVLLNQSLLYGFAGQCEYNESVIKIGRIDDNQVLLTLCHEAGHLLSHLHRPHYGLRFTTFEREIWAYLYGWTIIKWLKISEISKITWRSFHEKELVAYEQFKKRVDGKQQVES